MKNDVGQWKMGDNSLPNADHDRAMLIPSCEMILKMALYSVRYSGKAFYCFAKYTKHRFNKNAIWHIEYVANYWLFDPSPRDTLVNQDGSVYTICFNTIHQNMVSKNRPLVLADLSDDIIVSKDLDNSVLGKFCIQYRPDHKHEKMQFLAGSYNSEIDNFEFSDCAVTNNGQLSDAYYEIPEHTYESFVDKIK
jgi:YHS domain-containing protein